MTLDDLFAEYMRLPELFEFEPDSMSVSTKSAFGNYLLNLAAGRGALDEIKLLLAHGADIGLSGEHGYSALHDAAAVGCVDCVRFLLSAGANVSAQNDDGDTAYDLALHLDEGKVAEEISKFQNQ